MFLARSLRLLLRLSYVYTTSKLTIILLPVPRASPSVRYPFRFANLSPSYLTMLHLYLPVLQPPLTILLFLTISSFLLHLLVLLGSTSNASFLRSLYFLRFYDVSREKGVAGTPGSSSFFQVGLWNYCEGFGDRMLRCEEPQEFWWFNPMEEIVEKLFSGAGG